MRPVLCIGVPYWLGGRQPRAASDAIRQSGIVGELGAEWVDVSPDYAAHPDKVVAVNRALAQTIAAYPQHVPLIFSADCVSALGAVKGLERRQPVVLWYDAHGDFNTPQTTRSGFLGGMPLAALVGLGNEALMQGVGLAPIPQADVVITDARDLDPEEAVLLKESRVTHLPDFQDVMTMPLPDRPVYVHFDTDVVDSAEMPAMNYPTPGGPSLEQATAALRRVAEGAQVTGVLFSLWNDEKPGADQALRNTLSLVRALSAAWR